MSTHFTDITTEDWISQAEAARLRGVSRQAIRKLVKKGHLKNLTLGGRIFVSRTDVLEYESRPAGRPNRNKDDNN